MDSQGPPDNDISTESKIIPTDDINTVQHRIKAKTELPFGVNILVAPPEEGEQEYPGSPRVFGSFEEAAQDSRWS